MIDFDLFPKRDGLYEGITNNRIKFEPKTNLDFNLGTKNCGIYGGLPDKSLNDSIRGGVYGGIPNNNYPNLNNFNTRPIEHPINPLPTQINLQTGRMYATERMELQQRPLLQNEIKLI